jgi:hypothetical protein
MDGILYPVSRGRIYTIEEKVIQSISWSPLHTDKITNCPVLMMKYTARHIQKFLSEGKIDATLWTAHFPKVLVSHVPTCDDCEDFKTRTCEGGKNPVDCFLAIKPDTDQRPPADAEDDSPTEKNRKYYRSSRGNVKSHPTGIQKGYDQSKI